MQRACPKTSTVCGRQLSPAACRLHLLSLNSNRPLIFSIYFHSHKTKCQTIINSQSKSLCNTHNLHRKTESSSSMYLSFGVSISQNPRAYLTLCTPTEDGMIYLLLVLQRQSFQHNFLVTSVVPLYGVLLNSVEGPLLACLQQF